MNKITKEFVVLVCFFSWKSDNENRSIKLGGQGHTFLANVWLCNNSSLDESSSIYYYIRRKNRYLILYFHLLNSLFIFPTCNMPPFFLMNNSIKQKLGILLSNCVCIFFYCNFTCDYFYLIHFKYIEKIMWQLWKKENLDLDFHIKLCISLGWPL